MKTFESDHETRAHKFPAAFLAGIPAIVVLLFSIQSSHASSATWNLNPTTADWNTAGNWTPSTVPNGPADTATFATSNTKAVSLSLVQEVNGIVFNSGASAFTITAQANSQLSISGVGITNNSGVVQHFVAGVDGAGGLADIGFLNSATAGSLTSFSTGGATLSGAIGSFVLFAQTATAGDGAFNNNGGAVSGARGGFTALNNNSTGGNGTFTNNGGAVSGAYGGQTFFQDTSTGGNGTFTNNGGAVSGAYGGFTDFVSSSTAGNATLIANGGLSGAGGGIIYFEGDSTGVTARVEVFGNGTGDSTNGNLDISYHNAPGTSIGSIEGTGLVLVGANNLTVGGNGLSTSFSGVISNGGFGSGGSLTKVGAGTLTLSGANSYTGRTTINAGKLAVTGSIVSDVIVNSGGILGGSGSTGTVTVNPGGKVSPGDPQTLTVNGDYQQNSAATLQLAIGGTDMGSFDQLIVSGNAALTDGAVLELDFIDGFVPKTGDTFALVTFGSVTGSFTTINIVGLPAGFQYTVATESGQLKLTALNDGVAAADLLNISTRLQVLTSDNVLIGGFIITGSVPKKVLLRAIGPSLSDANPPVAGALADPVLELHKPDGTVVTNDNWKDTQKTAIELILPPAKDKESAIIATLDPLDPAVAGSGAYTAVVRGKNGGTGIGLVEMYDLDQAADSELANISTRGFVDTEENVMIGGLIIGGGDAQVLVRAIGPSLANANPPVPGALQDTMLELHDRDGSVIASNDDWKETQKTAITATGVAPKDDRESAVLMTLSAGNYTAIVSGKNATTGVALVEVYQLDN